MQVPPVRFVPVFEREARVKYFMLYSSHIVMSECM